RRGWYARGGACTRPRRGGLDTDARRVERRWVQSPGTALLPRELRGLLHHGGVHVHVATRVVPHVHRVVGAVVALVEVPRDTAGAAAPRARRRDGDLPDDGVEGATPPRGLGGAVTDADRHGLAGLAARLRGYRCHRLALFGHGVIRS